MPNFIDPHSPNRMQKSINRPIICLFVCIPLFFASILLIGTIDYKSQLLSFFPHLNNATLCPTRSPPLRVYMYDLPPRFNVRMMDPAFPDNTPVTVDNFPAWKWNSVVKQNSVEYWMMASLLYKEYNESESTREAIRVSDADSADVFFVPFFSSLSFNFNVHNMVDVNSVDEKLQHDMVSFLRASEYWNRSGGRDHVIPLHHPNAFRHHRGSVSSSMFVVADFGRILQISRLAKDVVAPYPHMVESYTNDDHKDPYESRPTLLFFRGGTKRKAGGKIRVTLHNMLNGTEGVIYEDAHASEEGFKASADRMRSTKFCLHPAGDTPSSCRLFDAIVSHCVPVIVSDKIELPYENELDYKEFSIFFSVDEALKPGYMVKELTSFSKQEWIKMWLRLKNISHHFEFQYPPKKDDAVNMIWRQVKQKVPTVKLAVHRNRRLKIPDWWR